MSFQYHPLPQGSKVIRLLELQPGREKETIRCRLQQYSLASKAIDYEPLSYCWGDTRRRLPILLDGQCMEVTRNLHAALLALRREESTRFLWADAVCINQNDVSEKGEQVQMIRQIYQRGSQTLAWLGKLPLEAQLAFRSIQGSVGASKISTSHTESQYLENLRALLELPYFTRVWVVQEIAVSPSVRIISGRDSISWDDLVNAIQMTITDKMGPRPYIDERFYYMRSFTRFASMSYTRSKFLADGHLDLTLLLADHRNCAASDTRDKLYALLGLANEAKVVNELHISPDYREEHTAAEAFTDTAASILKVSGNLDLLSIPRISTSDPSELSLPTWVPDWSRPSISYALPPISSKWSFATTRKSSSHPIFRDASTLGLLGYVFDEVSRTTPGAAERPGPVPNLSRFGLWFSQVAATTRFVTKNTRAWKTWRREIGSHYAGRYVTGESISRVFWRTLTCGRPFGNENDELQAYNKWEKDVGSRKGPSGVIDLSFIWMIYACAREIRRDLGTSLLGIKSSEVRNAAVLMSYGRSIFVSKGGYIGLGPSSLHAGDCLAFLEGGKAPYVLRRKGELYEIVGDCYIHGLMQGEAFDSTKSERIWLR
ncbi:heterokaryon incompatibility protein-domain-containing protein [Xylaria acuta]|nr:heterokaryon incompatibility protein-domain-containing protein [Xylaria acuta]